MENIPSKSNRARARASEVPLIHKVNELYREFYLLGKKIPKRDKFGIHLIIENICLELLELIISAAFESGPQKTSSLSSARIKTELLKRFVRNMRELNIIEDKNYLFLESQLQEISKMINGWIGYLENK